MNAMTCAEAQEQLDLLAADACDAPSREALEQHLAACPSCAALYAESRGLLGQLDLHFNQAAVERLQRRLAEQARRPGKTRVLPRWVPRLAAAAAVLLFAVGLLWWLPNASEPQFALLVHAGKEMPARVVDNVPAALKDKGVEAMFMRLPEARRGEAFRRELRTAQREGKLPPPSAVSLELTLTNNSKRPVEMRFSDLSLVIVGDGVVRIPAPEEEAPAFLQPRPLRLAPGAEHVFRIDRLVAGSPGKLEYIYLTEPGEYTLTARLRLIADGRVVTVSGLPIRVKASGAPP